MDVNDAEIRAELKRLLSYANAAEVAEKLGKSRATGARWARGESGDLITLQAVRGLLPENKKAAAPEGAAETLLRLWKGSDAPPWAQSLSDHILSAIDVNHQALMEQTAAQYADLIDRLLGPDSDDGALPQSKGPKPRQPGPNRGPQGPSAPPTG